ncbi:MAG: hypothetical protein K8L99_17825, partial [Anaerolineae bacterium]|nr:hypothetical protein [Anaerolineae bacterium]
MSTQAKAIPQLEHEETLRTKSLLDRALFRLRHDRLTLIAIGVLIFMSILSLLAPIISEQVLHVDYTKPDLRNNYGPIG